MFDPDFKGKEGFKAIAALTDKLFKKNQTLSDLDTKVASGEISGRFDDYIELDVLLNPLVLDPRFYINGFDYFSWDLPTLRKSFEFKVFEELLVVKASVVGDILHIKGTAHTKTDDYTLFFRLTVTDISDSSF